MVLVASLMLSACKHGTQPEAAANGDGYFKTHFQDESQFIVETILADLAEMASYAKNKQLLEGIQVSATENGESTYDQPAYDLRIVPGKARGVLETKLKVDGPIWAPEIFTTVARRLLSEVPKPAARHDPKDVELLVALTDLRARKLEEENQKLSHLLAAGFGDPTLHEMAAVILGAFALREHAENFYDVRLPLCRMTAHLAVAQVLSGGASPGVNGRLADAMLSTLMNNQADAFRKLKALETEPELGPWIRALRARNSRDYRELAGRADLTQVERCMELFAYSRSIDADAGWSRIPGKLTEQTSDFARIANGGDYSISLGHDLSRLSLPLEMAELQEVYQLSQGRPLAKGGVVQALNAMPERCFSKGSKGVEVRVIGWGQWAMFLQRHLCHTMQHNFDFISRKWSVAESAKEFADFCDREYGGLRLYPFVRRWNATTKEAYHQSVDAGLPVTVATPHLVSPQIWNQICNSFGGERYIPTDNPHVNEWHNHNPPPGTAYNPKARMYHPSLVGRGDAVSQLERLNQLAPHDPDLADWVLRLKYNKQGTYEEKEKIYWPMLEYSTHQNYLLAQTVTNEPSRYEKVMLRYATLRPSGYMILGRYFANHGEEEKAAGYYEKGIAQAKDEVSVSAWADWLVKYYFRKGEVGKAEALADRAAATYSGGGLRTKAELLETQGKHAEAFEYFRRYEERYGESGPLVGFCVRYKTITADARYDSEVAKRLNTLFPRGLEKVGLKDFKTPPEAGVEMTGESELLLQAGMKKGDVVVAFDGMRVYDVTQFQYVRERVADAPIKLIVWNGQSYLEVNASPPRRRFGVPIGDYWKPAQK